MWLFDRGQQVRALVRGPGRAAAAVGARPQLLRGAHDALGSSALALHDGWLWLQSLYTKGHAAQTGRRAQPRRPVRTTAPQHKSYADHRISSNFWFLVCLTSHSLTGTSSPEF